MKMLITEAIFSFLFYSNIEDKFIGNLLKGQSFMYYYMNHSQEFWDLVSSVMVDYEVRKEWLRDYGIRVDL